MPRRDDESPRGATIACAMDCHVRGILTLEDTDGIDMDVGSAGAMPAVLDRSSRPLPGGPPFPSTIFT